MLFRDSALNFSLREPMQMVSKQELSRRIAGCIGEIPASHGGYITVAPSNLRRVLDKELLTKIADVAAEEALNVLQAK